MNGIIAMESRMQRKLHVRFGGGNRADSRSSTTPTQLTETMGPYHYDCPASILDLLGPPGNDYAAKWREACRARLALTSRRKPRPGDMLVLAEPLTFTDALDTDPPGPIVSVKLARPSISGFAFNPAW